MIFYFSGTGNSYYAATKMQAENEQIVSIGECVKKKQFDFTLEDGESLGFVCPTYFYGIPLAVSHFIKKLNLKGSAPKYTYLVLTCGGSIGGADRMLDEKLFEAQGLTLDAAFVVKMPDNYFLMYDLDSEEEQNKVLDSAETRLAEIRESVMSCEWAGMASPKGALMLSKLVYPFYIKGRKTEKFWTQDSCIGCGVCASRCPVNAIKIIDGRPVWVKERCIHCLACARCGAVQYGKKTENRTRYVHPIWRKKKASHAHH